VRCCTDVSGFGLLGHLLEMLRASGLAARLALGSIPALPGALELLRVGWRSSADRSNRAALDGARFDPRLAPDDPRIALLCDPQTSGGLLAAVPPTAADEVLQRLAALDGCCAVTIGEVCAGRAGTLELVP